MEVARPLASAVEHARLHAESARRAEELAALNRTSQLITARLDLPSVLETISRSVTSLMGSTGCGIGLLSPDDRTLIEQAAAHGFRTPGVAESLGAGRGGDHRRSPSRRAARCAPTISARIRAPRGGTWTRRKGIRSHAERAAAGRRPDHRRASPPSPPSRALFGDAPPGACSRASRIRPASRSRTRASSRRRQRRARETQALLEAGPRGEPEPRRGRDGAAHPEPGARGAGGAVVRPVHARRGRPAS